MKTKFVLLKALVIAVLIPAAIMAQTGGAAENPVRKGRYLLNADFSLLSSSLDVDDRYNTKQKIRMIEMDLRLGHTFTANLEAGIILKWGKDKTSGENRRTQWETNEQNTNYGLYVRYHFNESRRIRPFIGLNGGTGFWKEGTDGNEEYVKYTISYIGGEIGFCYFINDNCAVDVVGGWSKRSHSNVDENDNTQDMDGTGLRVGFGLLVIL